MALVSIAKEIQYQQTPDERKIQLQVVDLNKKFAQRGTVLRDISFHVFSGEAVGLIGGNGSGKSTLLRCCLRLIEPDAGQVFLLDQDLNGMGKPGLRKLRSRVGLIFQHHNLVPRLSVLTNVIHGAMGRRLSIRTWFQGLAPKDTREEAMACLEKVGLTHLASSRADQLSGGESQRVAIARALMQRPQFMMADEPAASLDPKVGREVMELFVGLARQENITLLFVSHDLEHALQYSDRLIGLKNGEMVMDQESRFLSKATISGIYE
jgi:phosphonate transport system ATP-binding protein